MLKRKAEKYLNTWLQDRKQALLVTGARQVGKSYLIHRFLKDHFQSVIEIDFSQRGDLIGAFAVLKNANQLLLRLSAVAGEAMIPGKTAIFFDEIQLLYQRRAELRKRGELNLDAIDVITALKALVNQGDYRYVISGSLLGVTLHDIVLNPIGYLDELEMHPLDFEEFLWAKGVGQTAIEHARECFIERKEVDDSVHSLFLDLFQEYVLIGGMPEAVETYISKNNLFLVQNAQEQILKRYAQDITTYIEDEGMKLRIRSIFEAIPSELNSKNRRFMFTHVVDLNYIKRHDLADEFVWLTNAGIAIPSYNVDEPMAPLKLSANRQTLRLFMNDVGMLVASLVDTGIREKLLDGAQEINYGSPYENAAASLLACHGYGKKLYYYNSKKRGEVDFVIEHQGEVLPIEIKSGKPKDTKAYSHGALNNLIKDYHPGMAFVFGKTNVQKENEIIYNLPIYMIEFLGR